MSTDTIGSVDFGMPVQENPVVCYCVTGEG